MWSLFPLPIISVHFAGSSGGKIWVDGTYNTWRLGSCAYRLLPASTSPRCSVSCLVQLELILWKTRERDYFIASRQWWALALEAKWRIRRDDPALHFIICYLEIYRSILSFCQCEGSFFNVLNKKFTKNILRNWEIFVVGINRKKL